MRARLASDPRNLLRRRRDPLLALPVALLALFPTSFQHTRDCNSPRQHALNVHGIDLLERPALALDHKEINQQPTEDIAPREDVAVAEVNVTRDEGGEEGKQEIPEPVRRGREGHALGAVARRVQLAGDGPDHGAPGRGEAEDEEGGEADHGDTGFGGVLRVRSVEGEVADGGEDQLLKGWVLVGWEGRGEGGGWNVRSR